MSKSNRKQFKPKSIPRDFSTQEKETTSQTSKWTVTILTASSVLVVIIAILYQKVSDQFFSIDIANREAHMTDEEKANNFRKWFLEMGGSISPSVDIQPFLEYGGFGLLAKKRERTFCDSSISTEKLNKKYGNNVCSDEDSNGVNYMQELFTVPSSLITSAQSIHSKYSIVTKKVQPASELKELAIFDFQLEMKQVLWQIYPPEGHLVTQDVEIALELMVQCSLGNSSSFYPYLNILPKEIPRLDTFSEKDFILLQDEQLASYGKDSRQKLHLLWGHDGFQRILQKMMKLSSFELDQDSIIMSKSYETKCNNFESFHKYVAIVSSRAMVLNGEKFLTPMADMINHQPSPSQISMHKFTKYHHKNKNGSITVRADRIVQSGNQIFEDYGNVDNTLFLDAHGFVPYSNPSHCSAIPIKFFPHFNLLSKTAKEVLLQLRIISDENAPSMDVCVSSDGTISDKRAEAYCLILGIQNDERMLSNCLKATHTHDLEYITMSCFKYEGYKEHFQNVVQNAAKLKLDSSDTSLEKDLASLKEIEEKNSGSSQKILALKFRIEEKTILHKVIMLEHANNVKNKQLKEFVDNPSEKELHEKLSEFNAFLQRIKFPTNALEAKFIGNNMRIGVVANEDINSGDIYISVPSEWTISFENIEKLNQNNTFYRIMKAYALGEIDNKDTILILFLIYETMIRREESEWWPYLALLPSFEELSNEIPLLFDEKKLDFLSGSDIRLLALNHRQNARQKFQELFSIHAVSESLGEAFTLENFLWAHAIIDSRSIWWSNKRHLVPLLDLVNCMHTASPTEEVHSTMLDDSGKFAITRATRSFQKGEQLFENYGQPNYIYFLYHGFILEANSHDCVLINNIYLDKNDKGAQNIQRARQKLSQIGISTFSPSFCVSDLHSLNQLSDFLRIKYDIDNDKKGVGDDIKQKIYEIFENRLLRFEGIVSYDEPTMQKMSYTEKIMIKILKNEELLIRRVLSHLDENW